MKITVHTVIYGSVYGFGQPYLFVILHALGT
jgi:hypothetical protein